MNEKGKTLTQEQISALFYAVNEKEITGKSVMEEVEPLLREFYNGSVEMCGDCLIVKFLNGRIFKLSATAV